MRRPWGASRLRRKSGPTTLEKSKEARKIWRANAYAIVKAAMQKAVEGGSAKQDLTADRDFMDLAGRAGFTLRTKRDWKKLFDATRSHFKRRGDEI